MNRLKNGVTVELQGGLGNQLFILAAGYELAIRHNCSLYLDTSWFIGDVNRKLGIDRLFIDGEYVQRRSPIRRFAPKSHNLPFVGQLMSKNTFIESSFSFDSRVNGLPVGTRLRGYFQSWRYFQESAETIRAIVQKPAIESQWFSHNRSRLSLEAPWQAIHIRRGDYLNPGTLEFHGLADLSYYSQALTASGELPIKVFSDDLQSARQLVRKLGVDAEFMEPPNDSHPIESLILMSLASSIITANSSFSWWGAWLGEREDRPVFVPRPWIKGAVYSEEDLFLPNWNIVGMNE